MEAGPDLKSHYWHVYSKQIIFIVKKKENNQSGIESDTNRIVLKYFIALTFRSTNIK